MIQKVFPIEVSRKLKLKGWVGFTEEGMKWWNVPVGWLGGDKELGTKEEMYINKKIFKQKKKKKEEMK